LRENFILSRINTYYRRLRMLYGLILILVNFTGVSSWGFIGHVAIAKIAYSLLHPSTIRFMSGIMGRHVGVSEFADMSIWADRVARTEPYKWSKDLHFTHKGKSLHEFVMQEDPDCLLSSLTHFAGVLIEPEYEPNSVTQPDALRFLIHFTADLHAPFHIGDEEDQNGINILVYDPVSCLIGKKTKTSRKVSLHSVWDTHILKIHESRVSKRLDDVVDDLISSSKKEKSTLRGRLRAIRDNESIAEMCLRVAEKSRLITKEVGLFDHKGDPVISGSHLSMKYFDSACPIAVEALREAGVNLASILNRLAAAIEL